MRIGSGLTRVVVVVLALAAACDDGGDDDNPSTTAPATSRPTDTAGAGAGLGDDEIVALSDTDICEGLSGDEVAGALGIDVTEVAAGGSATSQCVYNYRTASGTLSNIAVASLAGDVDLGGRTGEDAYDYVLEGNRGLAGDAFEETEVEAGDRAVRLSGSSLHLGVVAAGGHLFTVLVPADATDGASVDALLAVVAEQLGG